MKSVLLALLAFHLIPLYAQSSSTPTTNGLSPEEQSALVRLGGQLLIAGKAKIF
jgi:hypothetical protein